MISKELLSKVLDTTIVDIYTEPHLKVLWYSTTSNRINREINIHELAYRCKEWAYTKGYDIVTIRVEKDVYRGLCYEEDGDWEDFVFECNSCTEPKTIFKACQWILDKNKEKLNES